MAWTIETGLKLTPDTIVSTDSKEYADIASSFGARVIMRPPEICTDEAGDYEVILHTLAFTITSNAGQEKEVKPSILVYLRPTTPFRAIGTIQEAISGFKDDFESLRSVEEMTESAYKCFEIGSGRLDPVGGDMNSANAPNQLLPKTYRGNGYVDIVRVEYVLKYNELWGKCAAFITSKVIEIDTEEDFQYAEWWIENH